MVPNTNLDILLFWFGFLHFYWCDFLWYLRYSCIK